MQRDRPKIMQSTQNINFARLGGSAYVGIALAENLVRCTANSATQCRSNPVSRPSLPKTGVFQMSAGDYRLFLSENAENRSLELVANSQRPAIGGPVCEY